mmetsp:Transcript_4330/g.11200  ORF Transcript_4330/g.11200 Transcript_4330/m.11200 type:complete len:168 (+) Transcript_4330:1404-1907(+)
MLVQRGTPQSIANILWAMATLGQNAKHLAVLIDHQDVAEWIVKDGSSQAVSNTIWAMASLGNEAKSLAGLVDREDTAEILVKEGKPQELSHIIWALGKFKHHSPIFLKAHCFRAKRGMEDWDAQSISNLAHALANLGYFEMTLFENLGKQATRLIVGANEQAIFNTL